ncbi:rho GTPase-activating protein 25 [Aplochiton taeniatus]
MSLKLPRNWDFSTFKVETAKIARSKSVMPGEASPGSSAGSPGSTRSMERSLKAGWLKKQQRSIVKNWQLRYFVLRGSTLTYHKDDKEGTVQGVIQLRFSKVNELPLNVDDSGKFLFEIIPRTTGERERCPHVLMANSQSDMEEWVRALRRVIGVPTSGVFGKSLADTLAYEQRFGPHMVPILVQKCAEYIREHGLNEEGIFRLPGQDNTVKQFRDAFDAGERPSFPRDTDVHTVGSLLKLYLRELPEPVVPWSQYQDFLDCTHQLNPNSAAGRENLEKQIALLPRANYNLLSYTCRFLYEVQLHSKVNKMSVENLATVMGINLLKPQIEDPHSMMKATPRIQKLMTVLIQQNEALFPPSKDVAPSPPSKKADSKNNAPRSFVGWESAELGEASLSESPEEEEDSEGLGPLSTSTQPSSPPEQDPWSGSPRKRTQTLPTFSCPVQGRAGKVEALTRWRIQEDSEETGATLSEDIFKILDLHRTALFGSPSKSSREGEDQDTERKGSGVAAAMVHRPDHLFSPSHTLTHFTVLFCSLQQKTRELGATVAELQRALEAERLRVAALETSLNDAERSRDLAERRNLELDKEIKEILTRHPQAPS